MLSIVDPGSEELCIGVREYSSRQLRHAGSFSYEEANRTRRAEDDPVAGVREHQRTALQIGGQDADTLQQLTTRMRPMLEVIRGIETVNIFAFIEEAFSKLPPKRSLQGGPRTAPGQAHRS
jgi:hypothetical protein